MQTEAQLIQRIAGAVPSHRSRQGASSVRVGIGDDAAILRPASGKNLVYSCDQFIEGQHFLADAHPPESVGFKALSRATSDLAAMGASPLYFLLALALPPARTRKWLDGFLAGMSCAAHCYKMRLIGGDVSRSSKVAVSLTVIGEISPSVELLRRGANPGDLIYVSGTLGRAQLGLQLVLRGLHRRPRWTSLLRPHLYPQARIGLGLWLSRRKLASAAIDISDGLSLDLDRLCGASRVGATLWPELVPRPHIPDALRKLRLDSLTLALHGGDDYELLFTVHPSHTKRIPRAFQGIHLTPIGVITREAGVRVATRTGRLVSLRPQGWDHFQTV